MEDSQQKYSTPSKSFYFLSEYNLELLRQRKMKMQAIISEKSVKYRPRINLNFKEQTWKKYTQLGDHIQKKLKLDVTPKSSSPVASKQTSITLRKGRDGSVLGRKLEVKEMAGTPAALKSTGKSVFELARFDKLIYQVGAKKKKPIRLSDDFAATKQNSGTMTRRNQLSDSQYTFLTLSKDSKKRAGATYKSNEAFLSKTNIKQINPDVLKGVNPIQLNSNIMVLNAKKNAVFNFKMLEPIKLNVFFINENETRTNKMSNAFYAETVKHESYLRVKEKMNTLKDIVKG